MSNHETLKALFQLDVDEVGEKEAAKRWEYYDKFFGWQTNTYKGDICKPSWLSGNQYRRKPGIPRPKVMQQPAPAWPADAPEWANYITVDEDGDMYFYEEMPKLSTECWYAKGKQKRYINKKVFDWASSLIERPKSVKQKIDWSKTPLAITEAINRNIGTGKPLFPTRWIAWNCDEHTRGNPLPDGLVVEWFYGFQDSHFIKQSSDLDWALVTRFRIVGIQEGWE